MIYKTITLFGTVALATGAATVPSLGADEPTPRLLGWVTNRPAVYAVVRCLATNQTLNRVGEVTNRVFNHYQPDSLSHFVWTNFVAHTNGRKLNIWSERTHPQGWPTTAPVLAWNRNGLMWGMKGLTGLSPCWEGEGSPGQVPVTALTRRHGYTRGHGMGAEGVRADWAGRKVWFVTAAGKRVEATIARGVVRTAHAGGRRDYTIFLFRKDLPPGIEPLRVVAQADLLARYPACAGAPRPLLQTEQGGSVNAGVLGLTVDAFKGGDSGSPDLLPLGNELVFYKGRGTSGPSQEMQADMDTLCLQEGLDPRKYQLQWVDLSRFPSYETR